MKSPFAISLKANGEDAGRIGPNKRSQFSKTSLALEEAICNNPPLPVSFDISPIQDNYFTEFTYHDLIGGAFVATLSPEVTAIVVEQSVVGVDPDYTLLTKLEDSIGDKYVLNNPTEDASGKQVMFLPGSNLINSFSREIVDRVMHNDPDAMIKPHPITQEGVIRQLGRNYGYGRMIDPNESGLHYLKECSVVYTASNSEFGIIATAIGKPIVDITAVTQQPRLSYSSIYRLFLDKDVDHNREVLAKLLTSKTSGLVFPWMEDYKERINTYYEEAMRVRSIFRPRYPFTSYKYSLGKD